MSCVHLYYWNIIPHIKIEFFSKDRSDIYDGYGLGVSAHWLCFSLGHFWEWGYEGPDGA